MSDAAGNYSFYNHNLRRPTMPPNRLITRQTSENALNNSIEGLSILSPSLDSNEQQFAGEPIVTGFVPHPPSLPRSNPQTPIRFRGKKRSRNESPRTSGSEDERSIRKQAVSSNSSSLSAPYRRPSNDSNGGSLSDPEFQRRRHFRGLEPLKGITSDSDLVNNFKTYQHSVKSEPRNSEPCHPVKVVHDLNGNNELNKEEIQQNDSTLKTETKHCMVVEENSNDNDLPLSDDSFTNVSDSEDDDTLSLSSESDEELRKKSEEIAQALTCKRYPNATLPSIPKDTCINSTGLYENMDGSESRDNSNTYESVTGFQRNVDESNKDIQIQDCRYASDTQLSRQGDSEFSYSSQSSLLPRVHARTVRLRNTNFLEEEMDKYFPDHKVGVFVTTWNMHEEKDIPGYLDDILLPETVDFLQDIYVIGLQESTSLRKEWEIKLQETLGPSHVLTYSCSFGVLHMAIFIRRELVWFCSAVNQNSVATRPGHMIKTKGGLAVSFNLFGTSFLFINSHLTSDEGKSKDRIDDYNVIRKSLTLQAVEKPWTDNRPDVTDRFDRVFWLGDFNFRVDMTRQQVDLLLQQNKQQNKQDFQEMKAHDQLTNLMNKGEVFNGYTEPDVSFPPTYKYDLNTETYDSSSKSRVPSWTDRILYKSPDEDAIKSTCYNACSSVLISDHRPVYGIYEVTLKPCKKSVPLNGGQFVRDVYVEANRRRATANQRHQKESSVCTIL